VTESIFTCGRTCKVIELCRFSPLITSAHVIHSHTATIKVEMKDRQALVRAIERVGGKVLGDGTHKLYAESVSGFGFTLPDWQYPVILTASGEFKYDNYNGSWGKQQTLTDLTRAYPIECARNKAQELGWIVEDQGANLVVFHPSGGTLTVSPDGSVDAANFTGCGCEEAAGPISLAIGKPVEIARKAEFFAERAHVRVDGGGE